MKVTPMLEKLYAHGFRTLFHTEVTFQPLTILIGKNGVGKSTLLDVVQLIGKFARGGADRAFGPPPWSLGWQRTKGIGTVNTVDFTLVLSDATAKYRYELKLSERDRQVKVEEERLSRETDHTPIASFDYRSKPASGTVLRPDPDTSSQFKTEIASVAQLVQSFESYELNPSQIERGNDPKHTYINRDGYGVASYLAHLKDNDEPRFDELEACLKRFRPDTESIQVWAPADEMFWGLRDIGQEFAFPAVHLSWGDRQLVGLLCVLFSVKPGATIAIEEIDRGFHPSRYEAVIQLLSEAVYTGLIDNQKAQVIITTHSPSFINKLQDLAGNIQLVRRASSGGTIVTPLVKAMSNSLGTLSAEQPIGDIWEMGLLEDTIREAMT